MGTATMGKVLVGMKAENLDDLFEVSKGRLKPELVRTVNIPDALVDTGATHLCLPRRYIQQLGLQKFRTRRARISSGELRSFDMYGVIRLTVQGRDCTTEVAEVADDCPALIGQVPLDLFDWVVDPMNQRLIGNPDHGGEHMFDMF
jgi:clan AA aspartic protease